MSGSVIKLRGVTFGYAAGAPVLRDLDFDFAAGERVGLAGPNGCGKTTLFHVIMGLLKPAAGAVEIFGKPRRAGGDFREVRRRIGLLFQDADDQLFSPTVAEDVAFGPMNLGKSRAEALSIVSETLAMVGLSGFENRVTYRLSGGEKKLVSLAAVFAMKPEILLLDEPVAGLDEPTAERIVDILNGRERPHLTISHDVGFLKRVAARLITIRNGRIENLDA
ncbi:MAG: ABC transporter ATP-binding protein [bacterium]